MEEPSLPQADQTNASALPLVTIVALCYNHASFLAEALDSILAQTYPNLEVILVDDASTDASASILRQYAAAHPTWQLLLLPHNVGNCAAFNHAYRQSKGEFLIDFSTDDVLLPERITQQVAAFQEFGAAYGVVYSDAELIDEKPISAPATTGAMRRGNCTRAQLPATSSPTCSAGTSSAHPPCSYGAPHSTT